MAGRAGFIYQFYQPERQQELCRQLKKLGLRFSEIAELEWSQIRHGRIVIGKREKRLPVDLWRELWKVGNVRHQQFPDGRFSDRDGLFPFVLYHQFPSGYRYGIKYNEDDVREACGKARKNREGKALTFLTNRANIRVSNEAH